MVGKFEQQKRTFECALEYRLFDSIAILRQLSLDELCNLMVACNLVEESIRCVIHEREATDDKPVPTEVS